MLDTLLNFSLCAAAQMAREDGFHQLADALNDLHEGLVRTGIVERFRCTCGQCPAETAATDQEIPDLINP
ncbi:hypothetical protein LAZ29_03225 [Cereibacter sphaeroides]|uniref:hypothetical protein n=1 Tax=Cereibacter sphaeroides TaxID=1063 RepID=UPI001F463AE7|nr:hypothetical protein [Cereibacter sphaeroides]MCE6949935.1 hypothetical protein [Cereibacter sphaeroides]